MSAHITGKTFVSLQNLTETGRVMQSYQMLCLSTIVMIISISHFALFYFMSPASLVL